MTDTTQRRLEGALLEECAEWIWEQLQEEEGILMAGELIELILTTERELGVHAKPPVDIAPMVADEFRMRRTPGVPDNLDANLIRTVLEWEDEFLGFAGIPRATS
jgi:hypothetical protein